MRGAIAASGAAFFVAATLAVTGAGLLATSSATVGWTRIYGAAGPSARPVAWALLRRWREARGEPPAELRALDGAAVELVGIARPAAGADGLWLVSSPFALHEGVRPPSDASVWVELPGELRRREGAAALLVCGRVLRARGILRVGLERVAGAQAAAYRLELRELWAREGRTEGSGHGEHCCH